MNIILIGARGVGKSSFINRLKGEFSGKYTPTWSECGTPFVVNSNYGEINFDIWDISFKFPNIKPDGLIIMFSLNDKYSLRLAYDTINSFRNSWGCVSTILIANKSDCKIKVKCPPICNIVKTSMKTGDGVKEALTSLLQGILKKEDLILYA